MWVVAIFAADPRMCHTAHLKRAIDEVFVKDLSIMVVEVRLVGQGQREVIVVVIAR